MEGLFEGLDFAPHPCLRLKRLRRGPMVTLAHFLELKKSVRMRYKDPKTRKWRQTTKTFAQTVNPFNKSADGTTKTEAEIYAELETKCDEWTAAQRLEYPGAKFELLF